MDERVWKELFIGGLKDEQSIIDGKINERS